MSVHISISRNKKGRDFVVGDIHGHLDLLLENLAEAGFDYSKDRLFSVGDIIDRGPKSLECLILLREPWFFAVRGNHEQMMIDWANGDNFPNWQNNYGQWSKDLSESEIMQWAQCLNKLPIAMTVKGPDYKVGICHAEPAGFNWGKMIKDEGSFQQMMWGRKVLRGEVKKRPVKRVDITLHGHTPLRRVKRVGNRYFLDTGAGNGDRLTIEKISRLVQDYRDFAALV